MFRIRVPFRSNVHFALYLVDLEIENIQLFLKSKKGQCVRQRCTYALCFFNFE